MDDVEQLLIDLAAGDLNECCDEVHPCLIAFSGERARLIAFLRPFPKGAYRDPLIEVLSLAMPLDADRLALSMGGRAWSLEDPVPPVVSEATGPKGGPGGDLRQPVLSIELVDGSSGRARSRSVLVPYKRAEGGTVTWAEAIHQTGAQGWIPAALVIAVRRRSALTAPPARIREQAERCLALGHGLYLPPDVQQYLGMVVPGVA